jgi:hypothetical protein
MPIPGRCPGLTRCARSGQDRALVTPSLTARVSVSNDREPYIVMPSRVIDFAGTRPKGAFASEP